MNVPVNIFKSYDIRGIYPADINEENIVSILNAIYSLFKEKINKSENLKIVVGRDMRLSSPSLHQIAVSTLVSLGADVIDVGLVSTPTFYFAVFHNGYDCGIQITASHNPKEYTGMKMVINSPKGLIKVGKTTGMEDIKRMVIEGAAVNSSEKGTITKKEGVLEEEVENALKIAGNPQLREFKIVADPANSMGALYIDALFKKVPGNLVKMNFELDGNFPSHQPDPLQSETLMDLQKKVVEENADFGLAPDGDGDRLFFIDEKGEVVPPSIITALVARELLKIYKGEKILFDIRYIITPQKIVEEFGGSPVITKVGHAFITEDLHKTGGIFAGESSGHYFFRDTGNAESQLPIILTVLKVLSLENKSLSEIIEEMRRSYESGEINFKVNNASEIIDALKLKYNDCKMSELDGIAGSYSDWRFGVRTSNTEPLLRLNVEALSKDLVATKKEELVNFINGLVK